MRDAVVGKGCMYAGFAGRDTGDAVVSSGRTMSDVKEKCQKAALVIALMQHCADQSTYAMKR